MERNKAKEGAEEMDMKRFLRAHDQARALFQEDGRESESIPLFEKALKHARRTGGWQSWKMVMDTMVDLGVALISADRAPEAACLFDEAEELANTHLGSKDKRDVLFCLSVARQCTPFSFCSQKGAKLFSTEGREAEAAAVLREALGLGKRDHPDWQRHEEVLRCGAQLVEVLVHAGQGQEALELGAEFLPLLREAGEAWGAHVVAHRMGQLGEAGETRAFKRSFARGIQHHLAGDHAQAKRCFEGAVQVFPVRSSSLGRLFLS